MNTSSLPTQNLRLGLLLTVVMGFCTGGVSQADTISYNVSFNNANAFLFDAGSGPYALDFYLTADTTTGTNTTSINGSNFRGSGTGAASNFALNSSVGDAESTSAFAPPTTAPAGSLLSFDITANYTPGSLDTFSFGIYKNFGGGNQALITTNEPAPLQQSFFTIDFSGSGLPTTASYGSNDSGFNIGAPTITRVAPVPEPSTYAMMLLGVGALGLMTWKRKRSEMPDLSDLSEVSI